MRWLLFFLVFSFCHVQGQDPEQVRLMEDQSDLEDVRETEEDLAQLHGYVEKPLNLNKAVAEDFSVFPFLSDAHVAQLIRYRALMGEFLHVLEMQAIPGWDADMIRKILPYVTVRPELSIQRTWDENLARGSHLLLYRSSLSAKAGFLARYYFTSPRLQWGLNTEKDAGERYFQKGKGLAFVSAHAGFRNMGMVRQLVLGDFIVNMGQGLVLWQGRAVRKTSMPMAVKRQLPFLQPYKSNDENRYFRGVGLHLQRKQLELGLFMSANRLDANLRRDSTTGIAFVSSFLNTGYHRTPDELADKNSLGYIAAGGMLAYHNRSWRVSANVVAHRFSLPVIRAGDLYNLFAAKGKGITNYGLQYHKTWRNMHLFGEFALDADGDAAMVQGIMVAAHPKLDYSVVGRKIARGYRAFQANAFTESSEPANEEGIYVGASYRLSQKLVFDAYTDHYRFPWLRYRVDAPGFGKDRLVQLSFRPDKKTLLYVRYRVEEKSSSAVAGQIKTALPQVKEMCRLQVEFRPDLEWEWRFRVESNQLKFNDLTMESGFLSSMDLFWSPLYKSFRLNGRFMFFDTDGYGSRIYSFENDVLFYSIIPAFYGRGARVYVNGQYRISRRWQFFLKLSRSFNGYPGGWSTRFQIMGQI